MPVAVNMPDDVIVLHDALEKIRDVYGVPGNRISPSFRKGAGEGLTLHLKNCGTALRFLEVHLEKCYPAEPITLTGDPRLMERKGKPTSQTASARILHGEDIPIEPNESPYITMTRKVMEMYKKNSFPLRVKSSARSDFQWTSVEHSGVGFIFQTLPGKSETSSSEQ